MGNVTGKQRKLIASSSNENFLGFFCRGLDFSFYLRFRFTIQKNRKMTARTVENHMVPSTWCKNSFTSQRCSRLVAIEKEKHAIGFRIGAGYTEVIARSRASFRPTRK